MTLLFFYKRLFLVANPQLRIFWWANFVFIVLWFFGATGFYLFQCQPVQYYFTRYYVRFPHPEKNDLANLKGECDATAVLNVSLPVIFSFISDIALLILPIWAVSTLKVNKAKKRGLLAVFGVGSIACVLELARILALNLNTDDKDDTSYGVVTFLILTAAEETTAVRAIYEKNKDASASMKWSHRSFKRIKSLNPIGTDLNTTRVSDDGVPLTYIEITGSSRDPDTGKGSKTTAIPTGVHLPPLSLDDLERCTDGEADPAPGVIHVRTHIQTRVKSTSKGPESNNNGEEFKN
ncbi:hypothetical protein ONZ43_g1618 [Nemania bipapillata]|uniref:Uncharacterized protein n=1 Tax=Nemania bipapillata TaxID=110536 RepID=A0ACC2J440_9PEZI|nr:hypothetical protein ONZ43_g1618 [Nemania bipapillata]